MSGIEKICLNCESFTLETCKRNSTWGFCSHDGKKKHVLAVACENFKEFKKKSNTKKLSKQVLLIKTWKLLIKDDDLMDQDTLFELQELVSNEIEAEANSGGFTDKQLLEIKNIGGFEIEM